MVNEVPSKNFNISKNEEIKEFWEKHARSHSLATRLNIQVNKSVQEAVESLYPGVRNLKILDVGTGAGFAAISLALLGHDVTGVDFSPNMLKEAEWNSERFKCHVNWVLDDIQESKLEDQFNLVIFKNSLFTICSNTKAVTEAVRLLKPGGYLLIMDGNYYLDQRLEVFKKRKDYFKAKYGKYEFETKIDLGNIEYTALGEVVSDLSVNNVRRPGWEVWFLMGLGMTNLHIKSDDQERFVRLTNYGILGTPLTYVISAQKPYDSTETKPEINEVDLKKIRDEAYLSRDAHLRILGALSNRERYLIVKLLLVTPLNVKQLSELSELPQNLVSYNLRLLKESGIVTMTKKGRMSFYTLVNPIALRDLLSISELIGTNSMENTETYEENENE